MYHSNNDRDEKLANGVLITLLLLLVVGWYIGTRPSETVIVTPDTYSYTTPAATPAAAVATTAPIATVAPTSAVTSSATLKAITIEDVQNAIEGKDSKYISDEILARMNLREYGITDEALVVMEKILHRVAGSECVSIEERSMVVWCILNRYRDHFLGDKTILEVCTHPGQFPYDENIETSLEDYFLVRDVVTRWIAENENYPNVGRTLPDDYYYFEPESDPSNGEWHNNFYKFSNGDRGVKIYFGHKPLENPYIG